MTLGIKQEQVNAILEKHNIKSGEHLYIDNITKAIFEILSENNKEIEDYLNHEYPKLVSNKMALNFKRRR